MRLTLSALLISTLTIAGCGAIRDSAVNPLNWFGKSRSEAVVNTGATNALIPQRSGLRRKEAPPYAGVPVESITGLTVERAAGGAILRVTGVARSQGAYEVLLIPDSAGAVNQELSYTLKALVPEGYAPQGSPLSREITAGQFLTDEELQGVRVIRVNGRTNAQSVRR